MESSDRQVAGILHAVLPVPCASLWTGNALPVVSEEAWVASFLNGSSVHLAFGSSWNLLALVLIDYGCTHMFFFVPQDSSEEPNQYPNQ